VGTKIKWEMQWRAWFRVVFPLNGVMNTSGRAPKISIGAGRSSAGRQRHKEGGGGGDSAVQRPVKKRRDESCAQATSSSEKCDASSGT
jgi:hypothetical protein